MMKLFTGNNFFRVLMMLFITSCISHKSNAQVQHWTETDRQYLLENLSRTRDAIIRETKGLSAAQWTFQETPDRWSIAGVIEHLAFWELIYAREIDLSLRQPADSLIKAKPDSIYLAFLAEEQPHVTKAYTQPQMQGSGGDHLHLFLYLRDTGSKFVASSRQDLRMYYLTANRPNVHQLYINLFGHCDRHLRQIRKIKENTNYPGNDRGQSADNGL